LAERSFIVLKRIGVTAVAVMLLWTAATPCLGRDLVINSDADAYDLNLYLNRTEFNAAPRSPELPLVDRFDLSGGRVMQWLTLHVDNHLNHAAEFGLTSEFPLFKMLLIERDSHSEVGASGSAVARAQKFPALVPTIKVTLPPGKSHFLLGVNVDGNPFIAAFSLVPLARVAVHTRSGLIAFIFCLGGGLAIMLYHLLYMITMGRVQFLYFSLLIASYLCLETILVGIPPLLLDPPYSHQIGDSWIIFDIICMIGLTLFSCEYLSTKARLPRLHAAAKAFITISAVMLLVAPFKNIAVNFLYIVLESVVFLTLIATALGQARHMDRAASNYLLAFVPVMIILMLSMGQMLGIVAPDFPVSKIRFAAVVMWSVMFSVAYSRMVGQIKQAHNTLQRSLAGLMPEEQIKHLLSGDRLYSGKPEVRPLTVMFIDIVGYTKTIKDTPPEIGFRFLREALNDVTAVIRHHNGIVDRSLGDGIVSFFGFDFANGAADDDHAYRAVLAAKEIQEMSMRRIVQASARPDEPLFPLRIGVHTDLYCVGNIGDESRFDLSLAGAGIFYARSFEASSEPYRVILGQSVYDALSSTQRGAIPLREKYVAARDGGNLLRVYELDPFVDAPGQTRVARDAFLSAQGLSVRNTRFMASDLTVATDFGAVEVLNYSATGLCVHAQKYLARGVTLLITLPASPGKAGTANRPATAVNAAVVWGVPDPVDGFFLGLRLIDTTPERGEQFVAALSDLAQVNERSA